MVCYFVVASICRVVHSIVVMTGFDYCSASLVASPQWRIIAASRRNIGQCLGRCLPAAVLTSSCSVWCSGSRSGSSRWGPCAPAAASAAPLTFSHRCRTAAPSSSSPTATSHSAHSDTRPPGSASRSSTTSYSFPASTCRLKSRLLKSRTNLILSMDAFDWLPDSAPRPCLTKRHDLFQMD